MPGMDGFELTRRIREHPSWNHLPVIVVTSLDQPQDISRGAEVGADEYIVKQQLNHQRLLDAVQRHV